MKGKIHWTMILFKDVDSIDRTFGERERKDFGVSQFSK